MISIREFMIVIGVDLSGPVNTQDTAVAVFKASEKRLVRDDVLNGANDHDIEALFRSFKGQANILVGIDAPLSYNPGGGDRPGDASLRQTLRAAGMLPGSVMTPTMTRMVYLTLRGMAVARLVLQICPVARIVEVHPGGAMVLRGAWVDGVRAIKKSSDVRKRLLTWLGEQGLVGVDSEDDPSDHYVSACAAALGAWKWHLGEPA
ncbi:MAG TPA: DUF429 domain-containing protein, partial [Desulfobacteraceae bacterium]|nr:DUF429 domain-containing protein [Desulfobacteraceae bacterium]